VIHCCENQTREHTKQAMRNAGLRLSGGAALRQLGAGFSVADLAAMFKSLSPDDKRRLVDMLPGGKQTYSV
jgi:hypothetical protein